MLFFLAFLATIALVIWFLVFSEASVRAKIIVDLLFAVSLLLCNSRCPLARFFMWPGLGIFLAIYHQVQNV